MAQFYVLTEIKALYAINVILAEFQKFLFNSVAVILLVRYFVA